MSDRDLHRRAARNIADWAAKGRMSPQTMERWQDKSREVPALVGAKKANRSKVLARCAQTADELRFSARRCSTCEKPTSRQGFSR